MPGTDAKGFVIVAAFAAATTLAVTAPTTMVAEAGQRAAMTTAKSSTENKPVENSTREFQTERVPSSGPPTFQPPTTYQLRDGESNSAVVADVNGDKNPDIIVVIGEGGTNDDGLVNVLLGNGDGTFKTPVLYDTGAHFPTSVAVADVNGDGALDLVISNCSSSNGVFGCPNPLDGVISVLLGNGDGTFRSPILFDAGGVGTGEVAIADLNGDGKPDLAVANEDGVMIFLGNGDGTFRSYSGPWDTSAVAIAIADLDRDGHSDLVVVTGGSDNLESVVDVLLGKGDGTFQAPASYRVPGVLTALGVALGDFNHDGKLDMAFVGNTGSLKGRVGILLGNGDGTFSQGSSYNTGGSFQFFSVATADVNGDGALDLVVGSCGSDCVSSDGILSILPGTGRGTFRPATTYDAGPSSARFVVTGDLNRDGRPDIVVTHYWSNSLTILLNSTTPFAFPTSVSLTSGLNPSVYGQKVTFTAAVSGIGSTTPTGNVTFTSGIFTLGAATLNSSGVATLTKSNLNADPFSIVATYKGDPNNLGSSSSILNQVVVQATSSTTLTSSPNPSALGQAVTFTATVTSPTVRPAGPVTFTAGKVILGTASLNGSGHASLTTSSLAVGTTIVTAAFAGDSNIAPSSASVTQTVQ